MKLKLLIFLLSCTGIPFAHGIPTVLYYNESLTLCLLKDGVNSFINKCRECPEQKFKNTIKDVIALGDKNQTDIPGLLKSLHHNLDYRIKRIEYLKDKKFDLTAFGIGAGLIATTAVLIYAMTKIYKNWLKPNYVEGEAIKKAFADRGTPIVEYGYEIRIKLPYMASYSSEDTQRFLDLKKQNYNLEMGLCMGAVLPLFSFISAIGAIIAGFNPHYEDHYLEKYKHLQTIIEGMQEKS